MHTPALESARNPAELVNAERGFSNPGSSRLAPSDTLGADLTEYINRIAHGCTWKFTARPGKGWSRCLSCRFSA
jgi:hypothetical protein